MTVSEFQSIIEQRFSKQILNYLVQETAKNPELFRRVWELGKDKNFKQSWRCLWIIDCLTEKNQTYIVPILDEIYQLLLTTNNESTIRFTMKFILRCDLKEEHIPILLDKSIAWMNNPKSKVSSQVLGLEYFRRVCLLYPEMKQELRVIIEDQLERSPSAGYKNRLIRVWKEFF